MNLAKKVHKLLFGFPVICVYGNEGDFSRYKLLRTLTDAFIGKDLLINKYIKDKCNVLIFPKTLYENTFAVKHEEIVHLESISDIKLDKYDWVYIPSEYCNDNVYIFPNNMDDGLFQNCREMIFVESFPFGKKEFCDYVMEYIESHSMICHKKIVLIDEGRKYGATDISDENSGLDSIYTKLSDFVDEISTFSENKYDFCEIDLRKQYLRKKRVVLAKCCEDFESGFFDEYEYQRQLRLCDEEEKGLLTDSAFEFISDYQNVKGSIDVEGQMLDNLIKYIEEHKKEVCHLIYVLYARYLIDLKEIKKENVDLIYSNYLQMIRNKYKRGTKCKCPESRLDYRVLCSDNLYVIKLRNYLEAMTEKYLRDTVHRKINEELRECEVEYYEKIEI